MVVIIIIVASSEAQTHLKSSLMNGWSKIASLSMSDQFAKNIVNSKRNEVLVRLIFFSDDLKYGF